LEAKVSFTLFENQSNLKSEGEATAFLDEKYLTLNVTFGDTMMFSYADMLDISAQDYKIDLLLPAEKRLNLRGLGYQYEDFLFQLFRLRNELLLRYLLMEEALIRGGFEGEFTWLDANGKAAHTGKCEIRLYDTAMVVLPQKGEPIRLPYCYISPVRKEDYKLRIATEFGEEMEFYKLGPEFDPLSKALSEAISKMMLRTQESIRGLLPEADPFIVLKLATHLKDGKAARRRDIEQLSPEFWPRLTRRIQEAGFGQEYETLNSWSVEDHVRVGIKRGLLGDLTDSYTWMIFPLFSGSERNRLSNVVALEGFPISSTQQDGKNGSQPFYEESERIEQSVGQIQKSQSAGATYFFRALDREEYARAKHEDLLTELEKLSNTISRAMIDINFRREPIFLSQEQLENPKYAQYRVAVAKIPALKTLRTLFVGRVVHSTVDQWRTDVKSLLVYSSENIHTSEEWKKGEP
jgi:hypothetical protein